MKVILGIIGTILGTLVGFGFINLLVHGSQTNLQALVGVSAILGLVNGINLAVVGPNSAGVRTWGRHAAIGAVGMGLLFIVITTALALVMTSLFVLPSLLQSAFILAVILAIGAVSGIGYRAASGEL